MISNRRAGREFMTLDEGETPIAPVIYDEAPDNLVVAVSAEGRMLAFEAAELRALARGRGTIVMGLEEGEQLLAVAVISRREIALTGVAPRSGKEKEIVIAGAKFEHHVGHRARMGRVLPEKLKPPYTLRVSPKADTAR
jgi:topoisomerase-4 subunit A